MLGTAGVLKVTKRSRKMKYLLFMIHYFEFDSQVYPSLVAILGYPLLFMCHAASLLSAALFVIWLEKISLNTILHNTHLPKLS